MPATTGVTRIRLDSNLPGAATLLRGFALPAIGWMMLVVVGFLVAAVPLAGLLWLLAGGLSYTLGVIFFAADARLRYGHMVWHAFVVGGTACNYFAVLWYAA